MYGIHFRTIPKKSKILNREKGKTKQKKFDRTKYYLSIT